jgi:hypothetical protein
VSVGEADYVKLLLDKLGEVLFWKIAMKPGRPLAYGRIGTAHFFGLPGDPVSVMVTFYQFVRDALMRLQGRRKVQPVPLFQARLASPIRKAPGRTEFQRGILSTAATGYEVRTTGEQGSGILPTMSRANCFIVLPVEKGDVPAGAMRTGRPCVALATPGGNTIGQPVPQMIMNAVDFGMEIARALAAPRISFIEPAAIAVEPGIEESVRAALVAKGHKLVERRALGDAHGLTIEHDRSGRPVGFTGGTDPRGEGVAEGVGRPKQ